MPTLQPSGRNSVYTQRCSSPLSSLNPTKLTHTHKQNDPESGLYRAFLGVPPSRRSPSSSTGAARVDDVSVLSAARLATGAVTGSVLTNVAVLSIEADGAVLVNVTARKVKAARGAVIYNVVDDSEVRACACVRACVCVCVRACARERESIGGSPAVGGDKS